MSMIKGESGESVRVVKVGVVRGGSIEDVRVVRVEVVRV